MTEAITVWKDGTWKRWSVTDAYFAEHQEPGWLCTIPIPRLPPKRPPQLRAIAYMVAGALLFGLGLGLFAARAGAQEYRTRMPHQTFEGRWSGLPKNGVSREQIVTATLVIATPLAAVKSHKAIPERRHARHYRRHHQRYMVAVPMAQDDTPPSNGFGDDVAALWRRILKEHQGGNAVSSKGP